ncbi:hypothetical protein HOLleu_42510 [Holothuria leucospilota]|uniref:CCHC-type domain-containing protein n=1 Tax=Holothuria leucospilota TaxID=206669 RepID=A0A9Q0YA97_HOLLE|nr:hypothetical protein HOLleu_42510 [Holothuria leucospilota]
MEQSSSNASNPSTESGNVSRVSTRPSSTSNPGKSKTSRKGNCYRCGRDGHFAKDKDCPARDKQCKKCGLIGHFAICCKTKPRDGKSGKGNVDRHKPHASRGNSISGTNPRSSSETVSYVEPSSSISNTASGYAFVVEEKRNPVLSGILDIVADFADEKRNVSESDISVGDQVLLRRPRVDKLSAPFHETPFEVVDKYHSQVTVQSPEGVTYKRNSSHVKKFESGQEVTPQVESSEEGSKSEASGGIADDVGIKPSRPVRTRKMPSRFKDFVIDTK